jgi:ribonucleotide monophosphatase NagD (HAD superfamily)
MARQQAAAKAHFIGKPNPLMMRRALKRLGRRPAAAP